MRITGLAKGYISSSKGIDTLIFEDGRFVIFNSGKCSQISGLESDVSCWISNNVRVFTPVEIDIYDKRISVNFTADKIKFVCERISKDYFVAEIDKSWFDESKIIELKDEVEK